MVARRVKLLHEPLKKAAQQAVDDLRKDGGLGGVVALDRNGNGKKTILRTPPLTHLSLSTVAMPMNSSGMYRGVIREDGVPKTAIFFDDVLS